MHIVWRQVGLSVMLKPHADGYMLGHSFLKVVKYISTYVYKHSKKCVIIEGFADRGEAYKIRGFAGS